MPRSAMMLPTTGSRRAASAPGRGPLLHPPPQSGMQTQSNLTQKLHVMDLAMEDLAMEELHVNGPAGAGCHALAVCEMMPASSAGSSSTRAASDAASRSHASSPMTVSSGPAAGAASVALAAAADRSAPSSARQGSSGQACSEGRRQKHPLRRTNSDTALMSSWQQPSPLPSQSRHIQLLQERSLDSGCSSSTPKQALGVAAFGKPFPKDARRDTTRGMLERGVSSTGSPRVRRQGLESALEELRTGILQEVNDLRESQQAQQQRLLSQFETFEVELTSVLDERAREADRLLEQRLVELANKLQSRLTRAEELIAEDRMRVSALESQLQLQQQVNNNSTMSTTCLQADLQLLALPEVDNSRAAANESVEERLDSLCKRLRDQDADAHADNIPKANMSVEELHARCGDEIEEVLAKVRKLDVLLGRCNRNLEDQNRQYSKELNSLDRELSAPSLRVADVACKFPSQSQTWNGMASGLEEPLHWKCSYELAALCRRVDVLESQSSTQERLSGVAWKANDSTGAQPPWGVPLRNLECELKALLAAQAEDSAHALRSVMHMVGELGRASLRDNPGTEAGAHAPEDLN